MSAIIHQLSGYTFEEACKTELTLEPYIAKGLLNPGEVMFLHGKSGSYKSFVALDLAVSIAERNTEWNGFKLTPQNVGVLIILGEGMAGYKKRLHGIQKHRQCNKYLPVFVEPKAINFTKTPEALGQYIEQAKQILNVNQILVIIDTYSLMIEDEISSGENGQALSAIRAALGSTAAAICVHHPGHKDQERMRGTYQLIANADRIVQVDKTDGQTTTVSIICQKSKEDAMFEAVHMIPHQVDLGTDIEGDPINTIVLVPTDTAPAKKITRNKTQNTIMFDQALAQTYAETGSNEKESIRTRFYNLHKGTTEAKRQSFHREYQAWHNLILKTETYENIINEQGVEYA